METALPRLRGIEAFPVDVDGKRVVCLRDPLQYASQPLFVPAVAFYILTRLDGRCTLTDVQDGLRRQFGQTADAGQVRALLAVLDDHFYLESPRFHARRAEIDGTFRSAALRTPAHAGSSYPAEPEALRKTLAGFYAGVDVSPDAGPVRGIVAPHIDLRVGGRGYGYAYDALRATDARRFVILGTSHCGGDTLFSATRKDFATPLGTVTTDRAFLDRLEHHGARHLYDDEILHRTEHSIEFQVVVLRHLLGDRPFTIVPILVTSFHDMIATGRSPADEPRVVTFVSALRQTLADDVPTVLIAGVDFAHVGEKFGDHGGLTEALVGEMEAKDHRLIGALEDVDAEAFFDTMAEDADRTRVCGAAPMYTLLAAIDAARGRLRYYDRTHDEDTRSSVSYASLVFEAER